MTSIGGASKRTLPGRELCAGNKGVGKRSNRMSQSSTMICLEGRSPGFFSENKRVERAGKGEGKWARRADLPICLCKSSLQDGHITYHRRGERLDTS